MPELPEVEVTRQALLRAGLQGARLGALRLGKSLRWPLDCAADFLQGQQVQAVARRGKYLLLQIDAGWLVVHLGMSGSLGLGPALRAHAAHDHFELETSVGLLRLTDPRRFGAVMFGPSLQAGRVGALLAGLGPEPLSAGFTAQVLLTGLRRHRGAIKPVLMAGDVVVGVGNIYACEALFAARIAPGAAACSLGPARVARLHAALVDVLTQAVQAGGSTVRNFLSADGQAGHFQQHTQVYGRTGAPCPRCATPVQRSVQAQRSTFHCPRCQAR